MARIEIDDIGDDALKVILAQRSTLRRYCDLTEQQYLARLLLLGAIEARKEQDEFEWREAQRRMM